MRRIIRSSCYEDESTAPPTSISSDVDERESLVGFRLVHETGMTEVRGRSSHSYTQFTGIHTMQRDKNLYGAMLGFRLVREGGLDE